MNRLFACTVLLVISSPVIAADANGYTAQYECRADGPNCSVDVAALSAQPCQQTISPSAPWSAINWSNNVICIEAGDHSGKGTLTVQSSGTATVRKVLRYYRASDSNDEPWNQSGSNQAKLYALDMAGRDFWIVHRLTIDPNYGATNGVAVPTGSSDNIFNRLLLQKADGRLIEISGSDTTLQNSVLRTTKTRNDYQENQCIAVSNATNTRIVNNEAYDCNKASHIPGNSQSPGTVIENSDFYVSQAGFTDCNGNYTPTGTCSIMEALISWKSGGSAGNPSQIINNRLWGTRWADGNLIQAGDSPAISLSATGDGDPGADYVLVKNNIITDSELGIWNYWGGPDHNSITGNILYGIKDRNPSIGDEAGALVYWRMNNSEYYFNTIIDSFPWFRNNGSGTNNDIRCNVAIASGERTPYDGSGVQFDYNVFYGSTSLSESNRIARGLLTRSASTTYAAGDIVRTGNPTGCSTGAEPQCFLYLVTQGGTTAGGSAAYCTTLGCTQIDGSVQLRAIRGPYAYKRKLRTVTGGETALIPYARAHVSVPEYGACPGVNSGARPGARSNLGISDNAVF